MIAIREFSALRELIENLPLEGEMKDEAKKRLADWTMLISHLDAAGVGEYVQIDLGIVRGLAYYTGLFSRRLRRLGRAVHWLGRSL